MVRRDSNGIRIPGWAIGAGGLLLAVFGAGAAWGRTGGESAATDAAEKKVMSYRLCRMERAMNIDPWPDCPQVERELRKVVLP